MGTVYELASFLALHRADSMILMPTYLPYVVMVGTIVGCLFASIRVFLRLESIQIPVGASIDSIVLPTMPPYLAYIPATFPLFLLLSALNRHWAREQAYMCTRIRRFTLMDAECSNEADRPVILSNIATFMHRYHLVPPEHTLCAPCASPATSVPAVRAGRERSGSLKQKAAIEAFEVVVHHEMLQALECAIGPIGIPYQYLLAMTSSEALLYMDTVGGEIHAGRGGRHCLACAMQCATLLFSLFPLAVLLNSSLVKQLAHLRGWQQGVFLCIVASACSAFSWLALLLNHVAFRFAAKAWRNSFLYFLLSFLLFLLTVALYKGRVSSTRVKSLLRHVAIVR